MPERPPAPRVVGDLAGLRERRSWSYDALDTLAEARGRRSAERGDSRFGTIYTVVVGVVLVLVMGGSLVARVVAGVCAGEACTGTLAAADLGWLGLAICTGTVGLVAVGADALGPAGLSPARYWWMGSAPADRSLVARDPLAVVLTAGAVVGLLAGVAAAIAVRQGRPDVPTLVAGACAGPAAGSLVVLLVALTQGRGSSRTARAVGWGLAFLGVSGALAAVSPLHLPPLVALPGPLLAAAWLLSSVVGSVAGWGLLPTRLRALSATELRRGGDAADATVSSLLMLESGALEELRGARARATRGRFVSRRLWGRAEAAVLAAEARRLRRSRAALVVAAALVPVPILVGALLGQVPATVTIAVLGSVVGNGAATGLRLWTRSSSIRRMFAVPEPRLRLAYLACPGAIAAVWTASSCAATGLSLLTWGTLTTAILAGILRAAPQGSAGIGAGELAMTPMGAVPVGLMRVLMRGPDVAVLPVALVLLGVPDAGFMLALAFLFAYLWKADTRPDA